MKNGVIASIVLSVVLTLTLAITTIATAFSGTPVETPNVYLAYRTGDICEELKSYKKVDLGFDTASADAIIVYNGETGEYTAKKATTEEIKGSAVDNSGRTYDLHIEVFAQGDGTTAETPWVIANAGHVNELSTLINDDDAANNPAYVEVKANVDMAKKSADFRPIGTVSHKFTGNFNGNNKTISNLTINVTEANYKDYAVTMEVSSVDREFLDLGLFGATNGAEIKDVCLKNETITVSDFKYEYENEDNHELDRDLYRVVIGGLVGYAQNTTISSTNKDSVIANKISANSYADKVSGTNNFNHGVAGVAGVANNGSIISGYNVNSKIIANQARQDEGKLASQVGGVVGYANNATIKDVNVTLTANATYNNGATIGGVASLLVGTSKVENSVVSGVGISGNETFKSIANTYDDAKATMVGGVAYYVDENAQIKNVNINNAAIDVKAKVGGVAYYNNGTITDVKVAGNITGFAVGGIACVNEGTIDYTNNFSGKTVSGMVKGVYVGGVAMSNKGTINGQISAEANAELDVYVKSVSGVVEGNEETLLNAIKNAYVAGVATYNAGTIENLKVTATVADGLNMAGLVNIMGKDASGNAAAATLSGITANVSIISNNSTSVSTTYSIGGAVNNVYSNSTITNNNVTVNVNQDRVNTHKYGAAYVGGLIARIYENNATITGNTVSGSIFTNCSNYKVVVSETKKDLINIGGFIGAIAGETESDSIAAIDVNKITVSGNTAKDLEIRCEAQLENIPNEAAFKKGRNIATFVGLIHNTNTPVDGQTWAITFNNNTMNNVHAYAYAQTFAVSGGETRYGSANYDGNTINGISLNTTIVVNVANRTNVGFEAIV